MRYSRALLISVAVTLVLTFVLQYLFGLRAFGLFLLLPFGFLFTRKSPPRDPPPSRRIDDRPIEPR